MKRIALLISISCTLAAWDCMAQLAITPSSIVTLISDASINQTNEFYRVRADATTDTNFFRVPVRKVLMITHVSTHSEYLEQPVGNQLPTGSPRLMTLSVHDFTNSVGQEVFFPNIGGMNRGENIALTTPIPVSSRVSILHNMPAPDFRIILRGYLTTER